MALESKALNSERIYVLEFQALLFISFVFFQISKYSSLEVALIGTSIVKV